MPRLNLPDIGKLDSLGILFSLLPGLLTLVVQRALSGREQKLEAVDAILHGLAYTVVVHAVWAVLTLWSWFPTPDIFGLCACAIVLGVVLAKCKNSGWLYGVLRFCGLSRESSWPTIWETAFREAPRLGSEYAVLYLKDRRRLMGAVRFYSHDQELGHVILDRAQWLDSADATASIDGMIIVSGSDIRFVQFLFPEQKVPT